MAAVTRDELRKELASFASQELRTALEEFRMQLLEHVEQTSLQTERSLEKTLPKDEASFHDLMSSEAISNTERAPRTSTKSHTSQRQRNSTMQCDSPTRQAVFLRPDSKATFGTQKRANQSEMAVYEDTEPGYALMTKDRGKKSTPLVDIVDSFAFDCVVGFFVVLNALMIGIETDMEAHGGGETLRNVSGPFFCAIFTLELVLRLWADGCRRYFLNEKWRWNVFDLVMVVLQILDEFQHALVMNYSQFRHMSFLRSFRLVRLIRITRLFRVVHLFRDLQTVALSILQSLGALFWAFAILLMVLYMYSVLCMQAVIYAQRGGVTPHHKELKYWFGSLGRTMLTMFECIIGGVSWDEVVSPLISDVSPVMGVFHCCYLSLSLYAITNMLTGVFVERATAQAREDKDTYLANRLRDVFFSEPEVEMHPDGVTWERFEEMLDHVTMQEFFSTINVDLSDANAIFHLLDRDGGGNLDPHELVNGCLRLRGAATALELALVMDKCTKMQETLDFLVAVSTVGRNE